MSQARISVESWDPEYGSPLSQLAPDPSDATVDPQVELPPSVAFGYDGLAFELA